MNTAETFNAPEVESFLKKGNKIIIERGQTYTTLVDMKVYNTKGITELECDGHTVFDCLVFLNDELKKSGYSNKQKIYAYRDTFKNTILENKLKTGSKIYLYCDRIVLFSSVYYSFKLTIKQLCNLVEFESDSLKRVLAKAVVD